MILIVLKDTAELLEHSTIPRKAMFSELTLMLSVDLGGGEVSHTSKLCVESENFHLDIL